MAREKPRDAISAPISAPLQGRRQDVLDASFRTGRDVLDSSAKRERALGAVQLIHSWRRLAKKAKKRKKGEG